MKKERKEKHFLQKPVYIGGRDAMKQFIRTNMKYPPEAMANKLEGTVRVRFTIDFKGKVLDAQVLSGLGMGCDEEAVRLVKLLKFKSPKVRNMKVQYHKTLNINFKLPRQESTKLSFSYQFVPSQAKVSEPQPNVSNKSTIVYQIKRKL